MLHEIEKISQDKIDIKVVQSGIGPILDSDIKVASGAEGTLVFGFNVKMDNQADNLRERLGVKVEIFDIIYKLTERLQALLIERTPKMLVEEMTGHAKILKIFSRTKDKQIIGGKVETGEIKNGAEVKILRRDTEIGRGRIRELQQQKEKAREVKEGNEFGMQVESKVEIATGDKIECFAVIEK